MSNPHPARETPSRALPWLRLIAAMDYRVLLDPRKPFLAAVGLIVLSMGWALLDLFGGHSLPWNRVFEWNQPPVPFSEIQAIPNLTDLALDPIRGSYRLLGGVLASSTLDVPYHTRILGLLWFTLVLGFFGGAICRMIVSEIAPGRKISLLQACQFAARNLVALVLAPACLIMVALGCGLLVALYGKIGAIPRVGELLVGVGLVIPLVLGLISMFAILLLAAGWPLLIAAVAAGATDALDAIARVVSYLQQNLSALVVPLLHASIVGTIGVYVLWYLQLFLLELVGTWLSLSDFHVAFYVKMGKGYGGSADWMPQFFWLFLVQGLVVGWVWCFYAATGCYTYLWLREQVDGTPREEIDPA